MLKAISFRWKHQHYRKIALILLLLLIVVWALIPAVRALTLVANIQGRSIPQRPADLPMQEIHFTATDGVHLAGWLVIASRQALTIRLQMDKEVLLIIRMKVVILAHKM